jgi:hypothetical protein
MSWTTAEATGLSILSTSSRNGAEQDFAPESIGNLTQPVDLVDAALAGGGFPRD